MKLLLILIFGATFTNQLFCQSSFLQSRPHKSTQIAASINKVSWKSPSSYDNASSVFDFSAKFSAYQNKNIIVSLPYLKNVPKTGHTTSSIGNLFVGYQSPGKTFMQSVVFPTLGIYLPTGENNIAALGTLSNFYELWKYLPDTWTIYTNISTHYQSKYYLYIMAETGPNILIPSKDDGRNIEICTHFSINIGLNFKKIAFFAEYLGYGILTESNLSTDERYTNSVNFGATLLDYKICPEIFYQVYQTEELRNHINGILGLRIKFSFI